jgi:hypothetical protein
MMAFLKAGFKAAGGLCSIRPYFAAREHRASHQKNKETKSILCLSQPRSFITGFPPPFCARIVPEDVGSGDWSDSVDCEIITCFEYPAKVRPPLPAPGLIHMDSLVYQIA